MYIPEHFREDELSEINRLIEAAPLATLVSAKEGTIEAYHLPMLRVAPDHFIGHIAAENQLSQAHRDGDLVLLIFQGEDSYVSPNWYPSKAEHGRHVPTWNYQAVHVHGRMTIERDKKSKLAAVGRLTKHHETQENGADAWKISDAPRDYIDGLLDELVAVSIRVERMDAVSKVSQNRERQDLQNVTDKMRERGRVTMAARMAGRLGETE